MRLKFFAMAGLYENNDLYMIFIFFIFLVLMTDQDLLFHFVFFTLILYVQDFQFVGQCQKVSHRHVLAECMVRVKQQYMKRDRSSLVTTKIVKNKCVRYGFTLHRLNKYVRSVR